MLPVRLDSLTTSSDNPYLERFFIADRRSIPVYLQYRLVVHIYLLYFGYLIISILKMNVTFTGIVLSRLSFNCECLFYRICSPFNGREHPQD